MFCFFFAGCGTHMLQAESYRQLGFRFVTWLYHSEQERYPTDIHPLFVFAYLLEPDPSAVRNEGSEQVAAVRGGRSETETAGCLGRYQGMTWHGYTVDWDQFIEKSSVKKNHPKHGKKNYHSD